MKKIEQRVRRPRRRCWGLCQNRRGRKSELVQRPGFYSPYGLGGRGHGGADLVERLRRPTPGDETYRVSIAAPGVAPADLNVVVHPDPRVHEIELAGGSTVYGTTYAIDKRVHLPRDAEAKDAVVSLANGILTLTVPKRAAEEASTPAKKMKLTIESPSEPAKAAEAEAEAPME